VVNVEDGLRILADHLYISPPDAAVFVRDGSLHLRQPGARLQETGHTFNVLLASLAVEYGARAMVVTPADGAAGSPSQEAIRAAGGLVLTLREGDADPDAAGLPLSEIAPALLRHAAAEGARPASAGSPALPHLDLQDVLNSADLALLGLDAALRVRFFTPATRAIFSLLPDDIGRNLLELRALIPDPDLLVDAAAVLEGRGRRAREIETPDGTWFLRSALPCWPRDAGSLPDATRQGRPPNGVVITFLDVTERKVAARALEGAVLKAETAMAARSRFLGSVTHALRQPLQTLMLLQEMLGKAVAGTPTERLAHMLEAPVAAMADMLKAGPAPEEPPTGASLPHTDPLVLAALLRRLGEEFGPIAAARDLELRVVPCGFAIRTDPALFEQILRNLLAAALRATQAGGMLLGCRRRGGMVSVEVWATDNSGLTHAPLREPSPELSIARRLAALLGHRLRDDPRPGGGRVLALEVEAAGEPSAQTAADDQIGRTGRVLVVAEDAELRLRLTRLLASEGHLVAEAPDLAAALHLVERGEMRPELLVLDQMRAGDMAPLRLGATLRETLGAALPVVILTRDSSAEAAREIALADCVQLQKPVRPSALTLLARRLLLQAAAEHSDRPSPGAMQPAADGHVGDAHALHLVDDDENVRVSFQRVLEQSGYTVHVHPSAEAFLAVYTPGGAACLLVDARLPGMSGFDLLARLRTAGDDIPAIMITGYSDASAAVQAMKAGASEFIEKPVRGSLLLSVVNRTLEQARDRGKLSAWRREAAVRIAKLTPRQRLVMERVLAGEPSKNIAADLGISRRTVETHRAAIMRQTGVRSLPALARLALAAALNAGPVEE
jgi:two-component system CheB/CheR fusion protein